MKHYYYKALKDKAETINGYVEANNPDEAKEKVRLMGFIPTGIYEENFESKRDSSIQTVNRVIDIGTNNLMQFTSELHMLTDSGISILQALDSIRQHAPNMKISKFANNLLLSIKSGTTFAQALKPYEKYVGNIYISLCKTGEESGALPETLKYLATLLKKKIDLRNKFIQISIYPTMLFLMLTAIFFLFGKFIFPAFIKNIQIEDIPPLATFFMSGSSFVLDYWWLSTIIIISIIMLIKYTIGFSKLKDNIANFFAKVPYMKDCMTYFALSHYMSSLYVAYQAGVPIVEALKLSEETIPTKVIRKKAEHVTNAVKQGAFITTAFYESEILPPVMMSMISTGEQSGKLEKMFLDISNAVHQKLDNALAILTQIFPLVMLVVAGAGVGAAAVALMQMYVSVLTSAF